MLSIPLLVVFAHRRNGDERTPPVLGVKTGRDLQLPILPDARMCGVAGISSEARPCALPLCTYLVGFAFLVRVDDVRGATEDMGSIRLRPEELRYRLQLRVPEVRRGTCDFLWRRRGVGVGGLWLFVRKRALRRVGFLSHLCTVGETLELSWKTPH